MRRRVWFLLLALCCRVVSADVLIELKTVATGLSDPLYLAHSGDGSGRLFVVEQRGTILILVSGNLLSTPFLDIRGRVTSGGERGLLGLAFHPNFKQNGRFFVNYTRTESGQLKTRVGEYRVSSGDSNLADATSESVLLQFDQPFANHNGGHLAFGADGYLYIGTGDGGSAGDPQGNGQNRNTLLGKILRIDVDRAAPYAIPPDNPLVGQSNVREEVWAYGLRNPWRFSFDRTGGRLFAADVGQNNWEEIDLVTRGGNYGWNIMEGAHCHPPWLTSCDTAGLIAPIAEYETSQGISVIGGYVYRGLQATPLFGAYLFGDHGTGQIWALQEQPGGSWKRSELLRSGLEISSFGEDESGELYVVHHGSSSASNGSVSRIQFLSREIFAQVGDGVWPGGSFRSTIIVVNNSTEETTGELRLYSSSGGSLRATVDGVTESRFPFTLGARSARAFTTAGTSDPLQVGWAEVTSAHPVTGMVLYGLFGAGGEPLREAGLEASVRSARFTAYVSRGASFDTNTGVALANPSDTETVQVEFSVKDKDGNLVATSSRSLGARQHTATFLHELGTVPADFEGTLLITATGEVAATLLRTKGGFHFSSLPVGAR